MSEWVVECAFLYELIVDKCKKLKHLSVIGEYHKADMNVSLIILPSLIDIELGNVKIDSALAQQITCLYHIKYLSLWQVHISWGLSLFPTTLDGVAVVNLHTIAKRCPVLTSLKLFDIGKVMRFAYISELRDLTMLLLLIDDMSVDYLRIISSLSDLQTLDIEMQRDSPVLDISCLSTMKKLTDITLRCNEERSAWKNLLVDSIIQRHSTMRWIIDYEEELVVNLHDATMFAHCIFTYNGNTEWIFVGNLLHIFERSSVSDRI
ncbi:hypothetical protein GLOIN_2v1780822 [Rhizophagus irregularis DAOM 181602=DAOM 197198]|nr:hypothetical protein GLOIN_2v1780822 [Rhizophagus irregularis DAOM 181602=DAOM 197198]